MSRTIKEVLGTISMVILISLSISTCSTSTQRSIDLKTTKSVVAFKSLVKGYVYGTGFNLKYKGRIYTVTNRHVCVAADQIDSTNGTARVNNEILKVIRISSVHDICILESHSKSGLVLSPTAPQIMDEITLIGHPRGLPLIIRKGHIVEHLSVCIGYSYGKKCLPSIRISATAYPGNSGSPVTNNAGQVVGILFAGNSQYSHEPFIVPLSYLKLEMSKL